MFFAYISFDKKLSNNRQNIESQPETLLSHLNMLRPELWYYLLQE